MIMQNKALISANKLPTS